MPAWVFDLLILTVVVVLTALALRQPRASKRQTAEGGTASRIFAAADGSEHATHRWLRSLVPVGVGILLTQLVQISGCSTTPTQQRLNVLESKVQRIDDTTNSAVLDHRYETRDELDNHQRDVALIQAQRDKRIDLIESTVTQIGTELMRSTH